MCAFPQSSYCLGVRIISSLGYSMLQAHASGLIHTGRDALGRADSREVACH